MGRKKKLQHCAGAVIVMLKNGILSDVMQIASRLGMVELEDYKMDAPTYEGFQEFIDAQPSERVPRKRAPNRIWYQRGRGKGNED